MKRPKSKKPRKQRRFLYQAPLHVRRKLLAAHLSKELREKYKTRSLPVRRGDEVKIMRGEFKKRRGKISRVNLKNTRLAILNFFILGLGYIYVGKRVGFGIGLVI